MSLSVCWTRPDRPSALDSAIKSAAFISSHITVSFNENMIGLPRCREFVVELTIQFDLIKSSLLSTSSHKMHSVLQYWGWTYFYSVSSLTPSVYFFCLLWRDCIRIALDLMDVNLRECFEKGDCDPVQTVLLKVVGDVCKIQQVSGYKCVSKVPWKLSTGRRRRYRGTKNKNKKTTWIIAKDRPCNSTILLLAFIIFFIVVVLAAWRMWRRGNLPEILAVEEREDVTLSYAGTSRIV